MAKLTFFPLGNADCCRIDLDGGQKLLFDFADMRDPGDRFDRRIDLSTELRNDLRVAGRDSFDVVAFTHLDRDHINRASEFFYLEHAKKYQEGDRVKIKELWVPASMIVEDGAEDEARILRQEARYRLRQKSGIRVFSRPELLKDWLAANGLTVKDVAHLVTDAGQLVPNFTTASQGVEFFVHSPFAWRVNDREVVDRNGDSLVLQATFLASGQTTRVIFGADMDVEGWVEIVKTTKAHKRPERLAWDVFKISHHCSRYSLCAEKDLTKWAPVEEAKWLFDQGSAYAIMVATCKPIPTNDDDAQPPHRQAATFYKGRRDALSGEFKVTMEHPTESDPKPLVVIIDATKAKIEKKIAGGASAVVSRPQSRVA